METVRKLPYFGAITLLAYMPFHIFLSQSLSLVTGGLSAWKIGKDVITIFILLVSVLAVFYFNKADRLYKKIIWLSTLYALIHLLLVWFYRDQLEFKPAALATVYNNRLLWFFLIGLSASRLLPKQINYRRLIKWLLVISSVVCLLGIVQYFLPKDILENVGYSVERGVKPAFFIDDKTDLPRIMSTLRDPNSLGAFLILPISILFSLLYKRELNRTLVLGLLGLHGLTLFLTFSRSAWAGAFLAFGLITIYSYKKSAFKFIKRFWPLAACVVLILGGLVFLGRDQYVVQNVLLHSDESTTQLDSNEKHLLLAKEGIAGIAERPLGHGPGTAGLVSIQNSAGALLTENYYIQIGYEVGLIGLAIFLAAQGLIYKSLTKTRSELSDPLTASFWGLVVCNLLLHTWSNEAVAASWWIAAGLAIGLGYNSRLKKINGSTNV